LLNPLAFMTLFFSAAGCVGYCRASVPSLHSPVVHCVVPA